MIGITQRLAEIRQDRQTRWFGFVLGGVVGLALASVHWIGLVVGGALVGIFARDFRQAITAGIAFGVVALLAFGTFLALDGSLGVYVETGQLLAVSVAIPLVAGGLGSLVRGLA